jgi:protein phosphatase
VRKGIGKTHIGRVRVKNEDSIFVSDGPVGIFDGVFIVADGMGGHRAGEVASGMAIEGFKEYLARNTGESPAVMLEKAVAYANAKVFLAAVTNPEMGGMGTTFSVCAEKDGAIHYAHVGDSRIYLVWPGGIRLASQDHSFVGEMVRLGRLTEEEAREHPNKNVLTRALGTDSEVEIDTGMLEIPEDGCLFICSDGLSNMVTDNEIQEAVNREGLDDETRTQALLELALKNGGKDNISLILVR